MHFRAQRKVQGEVSLSDALETGTEGDALYLSDVVGEEDTMLEELQDKENRALLRRLIAEKLTKREADILRRRYGLDGRLPRPSGRWRRTTASAAAMCPALRRRHWASWRRRCGSGCKAVV